MKNIFQFIARNYFGLLFVVLQVIAISMTINYNYYHKASFLNSTSSITGSIYQQSASFNEYLHLRHANMELMIENTRLKNEAIASKRMLGGRFIQYNDTLYRQQFKFQPAHVINNSVNRQMNYITIDRGRLNGVKTEMAVVSPSGVVGIVNNVSNNFATVIPILNTRLKISAKVRSTGHFGSLEWDGIDYQYANLNELPKHAKVQVGDEIITSGFSGIFPEGLRIGTVEECELPDGENFWEVRVKLAVDFKKISYVEVVGNLYKEEQDKLESQLEHE